MASGEEPGARAGRSRSRQTANAAHAHGLERGHQTLASRISESLAQEIYLTGGRLPSERVLAERLEVSRSVVREAIIRVEVSGTVEAMLGARTKGAAVAAGCAQPVETFSSDASVIKVLRARERIEGEISSLAAKVRTNCDVDRLQATLSSMRDAKNDPIAFEAANRLFHVRVAEATGNDVLKQMSAAMWDQTDALLNSQMKVHLNEEKVQRMFHNDLARVFDALVERDSNLANDMMRSHIEHVMSEIDLVPSWSQRTAA